MGHKVTGYPSFIDLTGAFHPHYQERVELTPEEETAVADAQVKSAAENLAFGAELERLDSLKVSAREKLQAAAGLSDEELASIYPKLSEQSDV
jgi:hypothetical protein